MQDVVTKQLPKLSQVYIVSKELGELGWSDYKEYRHKVVKFNKREDWHYTHIVVIDEEGRHIVMTVQQGWLNFTELMWKMTESKLDEL